MIIAPLKLSDLDAIDFDEVKSIEDSVGLPAKEIIRSRLDSSICYTVYNDNNDVVMIAGVTNMWAGFYEIWILVSPIFKGYSKSVIKVCKQLLVQLKHIGYSRIQADINVNLAANLRFVEYFGFTKEAEMPYYGIHRETYARYALYGEN